MFLCVCVCVCFRERERDCLLYMDCWCRSLLGFYSKKNYISPYTSPSLLWPAAVQRQFESECALGGGVGGCVMWAGLPFVSSKSAMWPSKRPKVTVNILTFRM